MWFLSEHFKGLPEVVILVCRASHFRVLSFGVVFGWLLGGFWVVLE